MSGVLLVGAGPMAVEYARVLSAEGVAFEVVGRGEASAAAFTAKTGVQPSLGLDARLERGAPGAAIVAVSVAELAAATVSVIRAGAKKVLVEKPGGLDAGQIQAVRDAAAASGASVRVGYNRRFLPSVRETRRLLAEDGGVTSFHFEFNERPDSIQASAHPPQVKAAWVLANSSHVIDLAFFLGGEPALLEGLTAGSLAWHPSAAAFAGCGRTVSGAPFSYRADWSCAGRWSVELATRRRRLLLKPLEELRVLEGAAEPLKVELPEEDAGLKPGLRPQVRAFLSGRDEALPTIDEQLRRARDVFSAISAPRNLP